MKYIIAESKLEETFMNYFDDLFDIQDLNWTYSYEYDDDGCFRWYECEYFNEGSIPREICPIVNVEHPHDLKLNGYFGDKWHEPFKKWFTKNFNLPVKTIE